MKKYLLGLTTAALLCSPLAFADNNLSQGQQMTAPSGPDSMPAAPATTTTTMPTNTNTNPTTTSNPTTMPNNTATDVQLKTVSGKIIHVQIDAQDLQGMSVGDKLEITDLGAATTGASTPNNGTLNTNGENDTTSSGASTNGSTGGTTDIH